jgi:hypothetical protein
VDIAAADATPHHHFACITSLAPLERLGLRSRRGILTRVSCAAEAVRTRR